MKKILLALTILCFFITSVLGTCPVYAEGFRLPAPGVMVRLSPSFNPPILKGLKVHPDNPFRFDFILDQGDSSATSKTEATRLIKYFLASLTIPEKDLWVNLSPYEKNRIIPQSFGLTEMGRDLLAEDYMLKQITASLIYPEDGIGKKFWKRIYEEAARKFGTTNIPVNTFNKVWIVPEKAVVYENAKAGTAYVVEAKLKVMLEEDYMALSHHQQNQSHSIASQVIRQIVIPALTKEVNENKNFAQLRQVYNSLILATWYKKKIKDSILSRVYADKNKIKGLSFPTSQGLSSPNALIGDPQYIYQQYLKAFKKGVYNYIKEDQDPLTQAVIPRKYFSGGFDAERIFPTISLAQLSQVPRSLGVNKAQIITVDCAMAETQTNQSGAEAKTPQTIKLKEMIERIAKDHGINNVKFLFKDPINLQLKESSSYPIEEIEGDFEYILSEPMHNAHQEQKGGGYKGRCSGE